MSVEEEKTVVSEVGYLLDELGNLVDSARRLPWGRQVLIDGDQVHTLLEQIRHALPDQMRQAEWVIRERDRLIAEAGQQADKVMNDAVDRARSLAENSEVVKEAQVRAQEILQDAERRAQEIHSGALAYADEVLGGLDDRIAKLQQSVRQDRQSLKPRNPA
jgi:cell division septum initiation protein DivIVA